MTLEVKHRYCQSLTTKSLVEHAHACITSIGRSMLVLKTNCGRRCKIDYFKGTRCVPIFVKGAVVLADSELPWRSKSCNSY